MGPSAGEQDAKFESEFSRFVGFRTQLGFGRERMNGLDDPSLPPRSREWRDMTTEP